MAATYRYYPISGFTVAFYLYMLMALLPLGTLTLASALSALQGFIVPFITLVFFLQASLLVYLRTKKKSQLRSLLSDQPETSRDSDKDSEVLLDSFSVWKGLEFLSKIDLANGPLRHFRHLALPYAVVFLEIPIGYFFDLWWLQYMTAWFFVSIALLASIMRVDAFSRLAGYFGILRAYDPSFKGYSQRTKKTLEARQLSQDGRRV